MLPPPPRSTLFPYTTLFRSHEVDRRSTHPRQRQRPNRHGRPCAWPGRQFLQRAACAVRQAARRTDRKSTRLNSSHTVISYAVFCLKKKKKKRRQQCSTSKDQ